MSGITQKSSARNWPSGPRASNVFTHQNFQSKVVLKSGRQDQAATSPVNTRVDSEVSAFFVAMEFEDSLSSEITKCRTKNNIRSPVLFIVEP